MRHKHLKSATLEIVRAPRQTKRTDPVWEIRCPETGRSVVVAVDGTIEGDDPTGEHHPQPTFMRGMNRAVAWLMTSSKPEPEDKAK